MKSKLSHQVSGGRARLTERYQDGNENVGNLIKGVSLIFTCRAATPEPVSDETLQAIGHNCAMRIVLAPEDAPPAVLKEGQAHD